MSSLIVAAIPRDDDQVWRVSSEKVPHLTMLYLGDYADPEERRRMIEFIQHACDTSLRRFGLMVDRRGLLGKDEADVLFFSGQTVKMVADFRSNLLANGELMRAYLSVDQYPEWTPHLTLGYPKRPARDGRKNRQEFYWVEFDRIAFWDDNYDGPTVELKRNQFEEVSMSESKDLVFKDAEPSEIVEGLLKHYGIKGMKWGVRGSDAGGGEKAPAAKKPRMSEDARQTDTLKRKIERDGGVHGLSNKDLDHVLRRMNLEQRYSDMTTTRGSTLRDGRQKAQQIINTVQTAKTLNKVVLTPAAKAVAAMLAKRGAKTAAKAALLAIL